MSLQSNLSPRFELIPNIVLTAAGSWWRVCLATRILLRLLLLLSSIQFQIDRSLTEKHNISKCTRHSESTGYGSGYIAIGKTYKKALVKDLLKIIDSISQSGYMQPGCTSSELLQSKSPTLTSYLVSGFLRIRRERIRGSPCTYLPRAGCSYATGSC